MDNKEMENTKLDINELEPVSGGLGGSPTPLPDKEGYFVYCIQRGDVLTILARRYGTTLDAIMAANPTIHDHNDISAGYYIYIPE